MKADQLLRQLQQAAHALYESDSQQHRQQANSWLMQFQKSDDAWDVALQVILFAQQTQNFDQQLLFVGINVLLHKMRHQFILPSFNAVRKQQIFDNLTQLFKNFDHQRFISLKPARVLFLTCYALGCISMGNQQQWKKEFLFLLRDMLQHLPIDFAIEFLTILPEEFQRSTLLKHQKWAVSKGSNAITQLKTTLLPLILDIIGSNDLRQSRISALQCLATWLQFCHFSLLSFLEDTSEQYKQLWHNILLASLRVERRELTSLSEFEASVDCLVSLLAKGEEISLLSNERRDYLLQKIFELVSVLRDWINCLNGIVMKDLEEERQYALCRLAAKVTENVVSLLEPEDEEQSTFSHTLLERMVVPLLPCLLDSSAQVSTSDRVWEQSLDAWDALATLPLTFRPPSLGKSLLEGLLRSLVNRATICVSESFEDDGEMQNDDFEDNVNNTQFELLAEQAKTIALQLGPGVAVCNLIKLLPVDLTVLSLSVPNHWMECIHPNQWKPPLDSIQQIDAVLFVVQAIMQGTLEEDNLQGMEAILLIRIIFSCFQLLLAPGNKSQQKLSNRLVALMACCIPWFRQCENEQDAQLIGFSLDLAWKFLDDVPVPASTLICKICALCNLVVVRIGGLSRLIEKVVAWTLTFTLNNSLSFQSPMNRVKRLADLQLISAVSHLAATLPLISAADYYNQLLQPVINLLDLVLSKDIVFSQFHLDLAEYCFSSLAQVVRPLGLPRKLNTQSETSEDGSTTMAIFESVFPRVISVFKLGLSQVGQEQKAYLCDSFGLFLIASLQVANRNLSPWILPSVDLFIAIYRIVPSPRLVQVLLLTIEIFAPSNVEMDHEKKIMFARLLEQIVTITIEDHVSQRNSVLNSAQIFTRSLQRVDEELVFVFLEGFNRLLIICQHLTPYCVLSITKTLKLVIECLDYCRTSCNPIHLVYCHFIAQVVRVAQKDKTVCQAIQPFGQIIESIVLTIAFGTSHNSFYSALIEPLFGLTELMNQQELIETIGRSISSCITDSDTQKTFIQLVKRTISHYKSFSQLMNDFGDACHQLVPFSIFSNWIM